MDRDALGKNALPTLGGREVVLRRTADCGFGFTLRHFVVYPPPEVQQGGDRQVLDTVFIIGVKTGSPAHRAGLKKGERIVSVQGVAVGGKALSFQDVVKVVQNCTSEIKIVLLPSSQDFLQQVFGDTAHHPLSNLSQTISNTDQAVSTHRHSTTSPPNELAHGNLTGQHFTRNQQTLPPLNHVNSEKLYQASQVSESLYAGDTVSSDTYDSSKCISDSSLSGCNNSSTSMSRPVGHPNPQQVYATPLPKSDVSRQREHRESKKCDGDDPHITIKDASSFKPNDNKLIVLPIEGNTSRKYYGFGGEQPFPLIDQEPQYSAVDSIQNRYNDSHRSLPFSDPNSSRGLSASNIYVGDNMQPLSLTYPNDTKAMLHPTVPPILQFSSAQTVAGPTPYYTPQPQSISTIYTSPGHPIIYPSQSLPYISAQEQSPHSFLQYKSNAPLYSDKTSSLYEQGRKTSLPLLRSSNLANYSRPVMDRKQAVHTIQNSLPLSSRFPSPHILRNENTTPFIYSNNALIDNPNYRPIAPPRQKHSDHKPSQRHAIYEPYTTSDSHIYEAVDFPQTSKENNTDRSLNFSQNLTESKSNKENTNFGDNSSTDKGKDKKDRPHLQTIWPAASVHKDYHVSPQKLNQQLQWPPPKSQVPPSPGVISKALTFVAKSKIAAKRRKASNEAAEAKILDQDCSTPKSGDHPSIARPLIVNATPKPYNSSDPVCPTKYGGSKTFVSNLPRIQENIPSKEQLGSLTSLGSLRSGSITPTGGTPSGSQLSLTSPAIRSIPLAWVGDNDRIKNLQIVSKRAKKFENSETSRPSKSSQRFELPRLSQRSNFSQRKQEFERMEAASDHVPRELGTYFNAPSRRSVDLSALWSREQSPCEAPTGGVMRSQSDGDTLFPALSSLCQDERQIPPRVPRHSTPLTPTEGTQPSGSRTMIVGGPHVHCPPPEGWKKEGETPTSTGVVLERVRANSMCEGSSVPIPAQRKKHQPARVSRHHSFLSVLRPKWHKDDNNGVSSPSILPPLEMTSPHSPSRPPRPNYLPIRDHSTKPLHCLLPSPSVPYIEEDSPLVTRRNRQSNGDDADRVVRRVSYLKATSSDRVFGDHLSDDEKEFAREREASVSPHRPSISTPDSEGVHLSYRSSLHYKLVQCDSKRAVDRSWKAGFGVIKGHLLLLYKDRSIPIQSPIEAPPADLEICTKNSTVTVASDYNKRRHVVRLVTPGGTELLLQADSQGAMSAWVDTLSASAAAVITSQDGESFEQNLDDDSSAADLSRHSYGGTGLTPLPPSRGKKQSSVTPTGLPSPSSNHAPTTTSSPFIQKNRKSAGGTPSFNDSGGEKSKTWKGLIGKRLKKMQGSAPASASYPPGASFGVPLHLCPMSDKERLVPLVVACCIEAIEVHGMNTQGIYRIPGNKAAVTYLTDMVNRGPHAIDITDQRWSDVNVISSLLKQYFQKLPEPLIPSDLYPLFMQAAQISDNRDRLTDLREMVHSLPEYNYETLKLLCLHLQKVVKSSESNRMDVHNLAIVFGPTLIRAQHDNMARMVKDMPHQCRIVEALISQASWFFSEGDPGELIIPEGVGVNSDLSPMTVTDPMNTQALLDNVHKIQGAVNGSYQKSDSKKVLVSSIISAASRKVNKSKSRKSGGAGRTDDSMEMSSCLDWDHRDAERSRDGGEIPLSSSRDSELSRDTEEMPVYEPVSLRREAPVPINQGRGSLESNNLARERLDDSRASLPVSACDVDIRNYHAKPTSAFDGPMNTYKDWKANTQERVKRFEEETKAMIKNKELLKNEMLPNAGKSKLDFTRESLDEALGRAKEDLESYDLMDYLADHPSEVVKCINKDGSYVFGSRQSITPFSVQSKSSGDNGTLSSVPSNDLHDTTPSLPNITHYEDTACIDQGAVSSDYSNTQYGGNSGVSPTPDDGSDMLSAITATFEKMRSEAPGEEETLLPEEREGGSGLYRDPSLHRSSKGGRKAYSSSRLGLDASIAPTMPIKRCDSLKSRKGDYKEKSEKRSRESKRTELNVDMEKRPKEMKHGNYSDYLRELKNLDAQKETSQKMRRLSTDVRNRTHNVRELKERFEQSADAPEVSSYNNNTSASNNNKRSGGRKSRNSNIKRRHTVGGTKDVSKVAAIHKALLQWQQMCQEDKQSNALQDVATLEQVLNLQSSTFENRERLGASSPDLPNFLSLLLPGNDMHHRRLSVRMLQPVLESHV